MILSDPAPRITPIRLLHVNAYLVQQDGINMLVDTGLPGSRGRLISAVNRAGVELTSIGLIILTHAHYDHAGGVSAIQAAAKAPVLCTAIEAVHLREGRTPFPRGQNGYARVFSSVSRKLMGNRRQFDPCMADITITDQYELNNFGLPGRVFPLPGHSAGSLGVLLDSGDAFIGDAAFNISPSSVVPPLADDPEILLESWQKLLDRGALRFHPGHGGYFTAEKLKLSIPKLQKLIQRNRQ